ncbi:endonuclease/exonuclease/phosphatase family protein [Longitalea luteola]|uniref:endonuclease/exonuclease/phosphatase family protein n=1 Tax=Longitalea luteola TaxID=2812563 RepID=UPI001A95C2F6|nr:endonuclease/exonuclease/phosphatase family protein [Longitalea luteola]
MARFNFIVVLAGVFLLSCSQSRKLAATYTPLTVLSYNIHHANPPSRSKDVIDLDTIAATIKATNAELVAIQELDSMTIRSNRVFQLKVLADKLGMNYHFERTIPHEGGAYGIGILSKYPIAEATGYQLPAIAGIPTEPRKLLVAKVIMNGLPVYFGCTHIDFKNKEVKKLQAAEVVKVLSKLKKQRLVFGGDFNAVPEEESIQYLMQYYTNAGSLNGFTIPVEKPKKKIDYIFYQQHKLSFKKDSVLTAHSYGSDHLPVMATFNIVN